MNRPVHKALEYSTNPFIPGISGEESASIQFLSSLGIELKKEGSWKTLADLTDEETKKLATAIKSKTEPDIAWIHSDYLEKLVQAEALLPLHLFISGPDGYSDEEMNDFHKLLMPPAEIKDTLYALPMEATTLALLYNKKHFLKAGLDPAHPPATWEELESFSARLTLLPGNCIPAFLLYSPKSRLPLLWAKFR